MSKRPRPAKAVVAKKVYPKSAIPYTVSAPNRFWRISKGLPAADYWKKRYWRRRITGRGAYTMDPSHSFGKRWGGYLGSKLGELAGGAAHGLFKRVTGLGAYSVKRNIFTGRLPQVVNVPEGGGTVIRFQEYLGDIITSSVANTFKIDTFLINAGNPATFPWLAQVASNYEQYDFEGMLFEFKSTSADALNSVNTALGSVMMATQYDTLDDVFVSKSEMLNYEFSTSCKPSESNIHMIECDPKQTPLGLFYTLFSGATPTGADPRLYHLGRFAIATTGFQGTSVNVGELKVTYQVRLLKPKLFATLGGTTGTWFTNTGAAAVGAYTSAAPLGAPGFPLLMTGTRTNTTTAVVDQVARTITFAPTNAVTYWRVEFEWEGTVGAAITFPGITFQNCTVVIVDTLPSAGIVTRYKINYGIKFTGNGLSPIITVDGTGVYPGGTVVFNLFISELNPINAGAIQ